MHNNITMSFCMLVVVSVFFSMSSAADVHIVGVATSIVLPPPPPQEDQTTPKYDDGKRRKRSYSSTNTTAVVNKVNSLRKSVGASDMNYLTYSTVLENDIANWTGYCDFDAYVYTRIPAYVVYSISTSFLYTHDQIEVLEGIYSDPKIYNGLRSVYLQSIGAYNSLCFTARSEGIDYKFVFVNVYAFAKTSYFNENVTQFTRGRECTTCQSGSYWCYEGLCRDDCSDSDSDCYCNSDCLNCAATDSTTCSCQCLDGWIGSRCGTANSVNTTTPTCSTTTRIPRTTTRNSNVAASRNSASGRSIGKSMFQLGFYAAVSLLLRMCTVFI